MLSCKKCGNLNCHFDCGHHRADSLQEKLNCVKKERDHYREALEKIAASDAKRRDVVDLVDLAITALEVADE